MTIKNSNQFLATLRKKMSSMAKEELILNKFFLTEIKKLYAIGLPDEFLLNELAFLTEYYCRETGKFELHQALNLYEFETF